MESEDKDYFIRLAEEERKKAALLPRSSPAAIVHRQMAEQYERRAARFDSYWGSKRD